MSADIAAAQTSSPVSGERLLKPLAVDIKLSADGRITQTRADDAMPTALRELLLKAVGTWKFSPARRKGVAIDWATRVTVTLIAVPTNNGFSLRVADVALANTWMPEHGVSKPPPLPAGLLSARQRTTLAFVLDPGVDAQDYDIRVIRRDGRAIEKHDPYAVGALPTVRSWHFDSLQWDGASYAEAICVPVVFTLDMHDAPEETAAERARACQSIPELADFRGIALLDTPVGKML